MMSDQDSASVQRGGAATSVTTWVGLGLGIVGAIPFWFGDVQSMAGKVVATLLSVLCVVISWRAGSLSRRKQLDAVLAGAVGCFVVLAGGTLFVTVNSYESQVSGLRDKVSRLSSDDHGGDGGPGARAPVGETTPTPTSDSPLGSSAAPPSGAASPNPDGAEFLTSVQPVTSSFENGSWRISDVRCEHALGYTGSGSESATYRLDGRYRRLKATFAVGDDAEATDQATLQIILDDHESERVASRDHPATLDIDLTGVEELELESYTETYGETVVAICEARLQR